MYRLAALLAMLVLAAVGCGGSDGDDESKSSQPATTAEAPGKGDAVDKENSKPRAKAKKGEKKKPKPLTREQVDTNDDGEISEEEQNAAREKVYPDLPPKAQRILVGTIARTVVTRFGLRYAGVRLANRGLKVTVLIHRAGACAGQATQEPQMKVPLTQGVPGLHDVSFEIAETGQPFGYFVLDCTHPKMPNGPGRTIFSHTGVGGVYTSKLLTIRAKRWALEWENRGGTLAVIVVPKDKKARQSYFKPVASQEADAGRFNYRGTGTVQLKIDGTTRWSVRIKEIR
jgi:hypothetical protein